MRHFPHHAHRLASGTALLALLGSCNGTPKTDTATTTTAPADTTKTSAQAADWKLLNFVKADSANPIMGPSTVGKFTDPILKRVYMLYRAENKITTFGKASRVGLASSTDGIHFAREATPVLYPANDAQKKYETGGTEDPRVVEDDKGTYYMTYTAYDGKLARLHVASSPDLRHWTKYGNAFGGKYLDKWSKSGSIVSRYETDGRIVAAKIKGKYWMYWGDAQIWLATSDDLIHWTPLEMAPGEKPPVPLRAQALTLPNLKVVLPTRAGKFDSDLVESGPPAMLTDQGIRLIYNSRNVPAIGDKSLPEGTYAAAQALFDKDDPTKLLQRMDTYFMRPEKPYETTGQVNQVVFLEGLARFKSQWFLYYGTADSKIAVAVRPE
jgi:predicted GH43/DUF377 family glycosyl hydrolase